MVDEAAASRAEWRAEEEAWSRAALERWEHGRDMADIVRDAAHRGDGVSFTFTSVAWSGVVVALAEDIVRVDTGTALVDVRLAPDAPFVLRVRAGGADGSAVGTSAITFLARLRELDGTRVCIGTSAATLEGTLRVGRDQLRLTGPEGDSAYVPTGSVGWVRPLDDD